MSSGPDLAGGFDDADELVAEALRREATSPLVAVALFIFFSVATEHFLAADNLLNILRISPSSGLSQSA